MQQLDNDDTVVGWTKRHKIKIKLPNGRNFVPDFLIEYKNGILVLEETKGWDRYADLKMLAMKEYCLKNGYIFNWIKQSDMKGYREWLKCL